MRLLIGLGYAIALTSKFAGKNCVLFLSGAKYCLVNDDGYVDIPGPYDEDNSHCIDKSDGLGGGSFGCIVWQLREQ